MNLDRKIGVSQTIMIIMLTVGITNHVTVLPLLLSKAGRDSWVSVLLAAIPFVFFSCVLFFINRRLGQEPLHDWLRRTSGPFVRNLILVPVMLFLFLMGLISLIDTQTWTTVNYLPNTPESVTALVLVSLCVVAAHGGIFSLGVTAGVLLPVVVMLGFFVAFGNVPKKDYSMLFPLFQNGLAPTLHGMLYAGGGYCELFVLLLIQQHVNKPLHLSHFLALTVIIVILTLSPLTGAIAEFGPIESIRQRFPAFEQWRLLTIGKNIENMEFFSIFQWLSGTFVRISLYLFLLVEMLNIRGYKQRWFILIFLGGSMLALTSLPFSDMQFVTFLSRYYYPWFFTVIMVITTALAGLALRHRTRQEDAGHDT